MENKEASRRSPIFLGQRHTTLFTRIMAKGVDLLLVLALYLMGSFFWQPFGVLLALSYAALHDGMGMGQSVGKRIFGLRVVEDQLGLPCSFRNACLRNLPFFLGIPLAALPIFWAGSFFVMLPLVALELYLILSLDTGVRLGDVLANTLVIEQFEERVNAFQ